MTTQSKNQAPQPPVPPEPPASPEPPQRGEAETERMRILRMIQEGKVSPEEGAKLLEALGRGVAAGEPAPRARPGGKKWIRIQVFDPHGDQVNVRLPFSLLRLIGKVVPQGITIGDQKLAVEELITLLETGEDDIVNIQGHEGERVRIRVE